MNPSIESPVAIVGSRNYPDLEQVRQFVRSLPQGSSVLSGGAKGVDQVAEAVALNLSFTVISFRPIQVGPGFMIYRHACFGSGNWWVAAVDGAYPNFAKAAHARNQIIVNEAASVVAFWNGWSKGTKSTIDKARAAGVPCTIFGPEEGNPLR